MALPCCSNTTRSWPSLAPVDPRSPERIAIAPTHGPSTLRAGVELEELVAHPVSKRAATTVFRKCVATRQVRSVRGPAHPTALNNLESFRREESARPRGEDCRCSDAGRPSNKAYFPPRSGGK